MSVLLSVNVVDGGIDIVTLAVLLAALASVVGATGAILVVLAKVVSTLVTLALAVTVTVQVPPIGALVNVPETRVCPLTTAVAVLQTPPDAAELMLIVGVTSSGSVST